MNEAMLRRELEAMQTEHRDLDEIIAQLEEQPPFDQLKMRRLKKRKLALKDRIVILEDMLLPDIIA